jgi:hypothetical protein
MRKGKNSSGSHVICSGPTVRTFEDKLFLEAGFGRVLQNKRKGVSRSAKRAVYTATFIPSNELCSSKNVPRPGMTSPGSSPAILVGIDRFMSECRALTNLIGNGVATIVVSRWEKELDKEVLNANLRKPKSVGPHDLAPCETQSLSSD